MDQIDLMFVRDAIEGGDSDELAQAIALVERDIQDVEVDSAPAGDTLGSVHSGDFATYQGEEDDTDQV